MAIESGVDQLLAVSPRMFMNRPPPIAAQTPPRSEGVVGYVFGGVSFIPLIGVPFGIMAVIIGALQKRWLAVVLGAGGILFTVLLYGSLFYFGFVQRGGVYDALRSSMAGTMLKSAVREVEYYKQVHGEYPASLRDLDAQTKGGLSTLIDPTEMQRHPFGGTPYFFYQRLPDGKGYYLRSVGPDGVPFTADDIVPDIPPAERAKIGLRIEAPRANKSPEATPGQHPPAPPSPSSGAPHL